MSRIKGQISNILRKCRLIDFTDLARFYLLRWKNRKVNRDFRTNNPGVKLPPDYLLYESFQLNYFEYYTESIDTAKWLTSLFRKHIDLTGIRILDWGCGPGRIIRHLPAVIGNGCQYFGTDYNKESIDWCITNLPGISFNYNSLKAGLPYSDSFFDVIYGISIFTHLSKQLHFDWYNELFRVLKSNGIMLLTTQGDNFKVKLTKHEIIQYNTNELVIRGNVKEGRRTFSAFHPNVFMRSLFANAEILEHIETMPEKGKSPPQDIWIIRKE